MTDRSPVPFHFVGLFHLLLPLGRSGGLGRSSGDPDAQRNIGRSWVYPRGALHTRGGRNRRLAMRSRRGRWKRARGGGLPSEGGAWGRGLDGSICKSPKMYPNLVDEEKRIQCVKSHQSLKRPYLPQHPL